MTILQIDDTHTYTYVRTYEHILLTVCQMYCLVQTPDIPDFSSRFIVFTFSRPDS